MTKRTDTTTKATPKTSGAAARPQAVLCDGDCSHCNGTGWIGDIKCPACT